MEKEKLITLVKTAKSGNQKAIEELLCLAHTSVSYQCRKMLPNTQDAEDLTQEILLTVYQKLDSLQEPATFWGWLNRITATRCMNAISRTQVDLQFAEDEDGNSILDSLETLDEHQIPDKAIDNAETARMIDEIVSGLPEVQRMATLLYYYDEMSVKEIAQIMDVSENTVKGRLHLARKAIKEKVQEYEKQGVKLYSVSMLPFLWYFLRSASQHEADAAAATHCAANVMAAGTVNSAVGTATGATVTRVTAFLTKKVIAGIISGAVAIGGVAVATIMSINEFSPTVPAFICQHEWVDANCTTPRTCHKCGSVEGEMLGHQWIDADCEQPKTCTICGATESEALGHSWADGNCTDPKRCQICSAIGGEIPGHEWIAADCENPKTCNACGATEGEKLEHIWADATCDNPSKCTLCGLSKGDPVHAWEEANYQAPKTCSLCGKTDGEALIPNLKAWGLNIISLELGKEYDYITCCNTNREMKTVAKAVYSNLRVFEGDETHEAAEGYVWYAISLDITFSDENAVKYGAETYEFYLDYYASGKWSDKPWEEGVGNGDTFSVNYYGRDYSDCMISYINPGFLGWVADTCTYHCEYAFRVPVGYDGIMFGLLDASIEVVPGKQLYEIVDENTLLFRLDYSLAESGYVSEPLVTWSRTGETLYAYLPADVYNEPNAGNDKTGSLSAGQPVVVYSVGSNGWSCIEYEDGFAYVYSDKLITPVDPETNTFVVTQTNQKAEYRTGPGTDYDLVGYVESGRYITVPYGVKSENGWIQFQIGMSGPWYYIRTDHISGWEEWWERYAGPADPKTGISWDGVSPIIYTYPDGSTGTELRDGAQYEASPGNIVTYEAPRDAVGRVIGTICETCGKAVGTYLTRDTDCYQTTYSEYCSDCGKWKDAYTCHSCVAVDGVEYCYQCGKVDGDGTNGTCYMNPIGGADEICDNCGATVPRGYCHTCNIP